MRQKIQVILIGILLVASGVAGYVVLQLQTPAQHIRVLRVVAKQYTYIPDTIQLRYGEWVKLQLTTADVAHSFTLPSYNINQIVSPGKETDILIHATKKGTFTFFCDIYCGPAESGMLGKVVVQ